jgi:Zn-dependent M16 (insulinase) family peptidase
MERNSQKRGVFHSTKTKILSLFTFDSTLRLQVTVAKVQQSLPEMKRDGNTVLGSLWADLLFGLNSTSRLSGVLPQTEFIPQLMTELQENPEKVINDFEEIRNAG